MTSLALLPNLMGPDGLIIFLIILLLFGAKKLPELARGLGSAVREFSKAKDEIHHEITRPAPLPESRDQHGKNMDDEYHRQAQASDDEYHRRMREEQTQQPAAQVKEPVVVSNSEFKEKPTPGSPTTIPSNPSHPGTPV